MCGGSSKFVVMCAANLHGQMLASKNLFSYVGVSTFPVVLLFQAVWLTATHVFKLHEAHTNCVPNAG